MAQKKINIAVAGATGAVGNQMIRCLEEMNFPTHSVQLLASSRSVGRQLRFKGDLIDVKEMKADSFKGVDIALFSAGGGTSEKFAPFAAKDGCVVIDNSSAWRMDPQVPLVVPEVNAHAIAQHTEKGIIANPYQAVSGTGKKAVDELFDQSRAMINFLDYENRVYPHRIAFNCLPHIDAFLDNGYTKEEMKMVNETRKIMEDDSIAVTATTVRVPVFFGHSESVNIETNQPVSADDVKVLLANTPGVKVLDDPANNLYPLATDAAGQDLTLVGRIRNDESIPNGINMWIVADNIRKGAATNTVQIAQILADEYL
jgi:aspartate-semialdehyde dehydrogenase